MKRTTVRFIRGIGRVLGVKPNKINIRPKRSGVHIYFNRTGNYIRAATKDYYRSLPAESQNAVDDELQRIFNEKTDSTKDEAGEQLSLPVF